MKSFLIALVILSGSFAQAEIKVGDTALYALTNSDGQTLDLLAEVTAVDRAHDLLTLNQTLSNSEGDSQQSVEQMKLSEQENNEMIFDACLQLPADLNPRYESITVAAGKFNTCHLTAKDDRGATLDGYFAKVSFGFVKITKQGSTDDSDFEMELKSFKKN